MTTIRSALLAALVATLALAAPASATRDDGGTTGVFATGAGSRAAAMGGASVAAGDGAWSWTWNPGSLAWLSRANAEFVQGTPDAIGARETQAAIAVPDWRWGALALSWRQFGVDDLDGRDARGASTGDFAARESELGVAYGRDLGPAFGAGVAVKLRRQSLAGRSGGGVGADAGASLRLSGLPGADESWWRDLSFGVRLGNVLSPAVRLDLDEVSEPSVWSGGLAWTRRTGATSLALAADVEQVSGGLARGRVGAEVGVRSALALRAGWNGERMTAGTGVTWRGLDLAYTWQDNALGAEQRMSLGWRFGRTVSESRELAAEAREREIQQRLQVAFDEDLARRAQSVRAEAEQALAAGDLDEAWDRASVLQAIAPRAAETSALMTRVLATRAERLERAGDWDGARLEWEKALELSPTDPASTRGVARCRDQGDRLAKRGAEHRRLHDAALRAIAAGDPAGARVRLDSLRAGGVADSALAPLQLRLDRLTAAQLDSRLEQVQRLAAAGLFDEAAAMLERARAMAPGSPAVARARDLLVRARPASARPSPAATAAAPSPARAGASEAAKREAEQLYQSGLAAARGGRGDLAVRSWELAALKNPQHPRVRELLKREYQTRGLDAFSAGRLSEAVSQWQRALQLDPTDARTRSYLDRAQEHLSRSAELGMGR